MNDDTRAVLAALTRIARPATELVGITGLSHERLYTALVRLESSGKACLKVLPHERHGRARGWARPAGVFDGLAA